MRPRELHRDLYRDRNSESELCLDFPGDEVLIDGLHAMQTHFWNNNVTIDIPILRVMNTAHFLAAYMFSTTCSGDQMEYDAIADMSLGRDKQLFKISIIVLAAMLARTEGFHARQCRNMLLDNRDPDFDEGVELYNRFLRSAEKRFAEEDFFIGTQVKIQQLQAENEQLIAENAQLKFNYRIMEEKYTQINIGTQNNYSGCTINNYYGQPSTTADKKEEPQDLIADSSSCAPDLGSDILDSKIFTKKAKQEHKEAEIIAALKKSVNGRKDKTRAFVDELHSWQHDGYVDARYNAHVMYEELEKLMPLSFGYNAFRKHYTNLL